MSDALRFRTLEPEVMDSFDDALEYNSMDHAEVNCAFVGQLLEAAPELAISPTADEGEFSFSAVGGFDFPGAGSLPEVLDLGTGTALIPIELCRRAKYCRVVAVDLAVSMLEIARYNLESSGVQERIRLDLVDAKQLKFSDGHFAVVMSNSIVHHIPEPLDVLREAVRVAAPGGLILFRDLVRPRDETELNELVNTYAGSASEYQRALFAASFRAALTLDEIRDLVGSLGCNPDDVRLSSDRHWTWNARMPGKM